MIGGCQVFEDKHGRTRRLRLAIGIFARRALDKSQREVERFQARVASQGNDPRVTPAIRLVNKREGHAKVY